MTIFEYLQANPDSTSGDIARGLRKGTSSVAGTISQLYTTGRIIKSGVKNEIVTWRINDMPYGYSNALLIQFNQLLRKCRMKQSELPKCPTCGATPEYNVRGPKWGLYRGSLRPPCNHHFVILESPAGSRELAEKKLAANWCDLVKEIRKGAA